MPITGGSCRKLWNETAVVMVSRNSAMIVFAPGFMVTISPLLSGCPAGTAKCMMAAGTTKLTSDGTNSTKKVQNSTMPFCHTIRVVMSPNGLNAPPALAPTTMLIQARVTKRVLSPPTASTTAHISSAVVRLSATGEMKKARMPVSQNSVRKPKPLRTSQERSASNTLRSSMALM